MSDDTRGGNIEPGPVGPTELTLREAFALGTKVICLLVVVTILSAGAVGCSVFFIYMCFMHPDVATTLLPLLIPAGMGALVLRYGKKAAALLSKDERNLPK